MEENRKSNSNPVGKFLFWMAGADKTLLDKCNSRVRMLYSGLGIIFLINYALLLMAWTKLGLRYFGPLGVLPGTLVPSVFLALDRLIAMRPRELTGVLAVYNVEQKLTKKSELWLRISMATALSLATTFTFQMDQAHSLIEGKATEQSKLANSALLTEMTSRVNEERQALVDSANQHKSKLNEQRSFLLAERDVAAKNEKDSSDLAKSAANERQREVGGTDGRAAGDKSKAQAQGQIAANNERFAAIARADKETAAKAIADIEGKALAADLSVINAEKETSKKLSELSEKMKADLRYVPPKQGLFSDATIFVGLFSDKDVAPGMWLYSFITFGVLITLELAALLGLLLLPINEYDLAVLAETRTEASRIVGDAEIKLVQRASNDPPIIIRPRSGAGAQSRQKAAQGDQNERS